MATTVSPVSEVELVDALVRAVHALREDAAARRLAPRHETVRALADRDDYAANVLEDVLSELRRPVAKAC
jgi:hypothetical protein